MPVVFRKVDDEEMQANVEACESAPDSTDCFLATRLLEFRIHG